MNEMNMSETSRIIKGLREAGWSDTKINDFMLYIEENNQSFLEKLKNGEYNEG